jgi:hypothetical protein
MLVLKYFLTMGAVLLAGLLALSTYLTPPGGDSRGSVYTPTTASLPVIAAAPAPQPDKASLAEQPAPQAAKAVPADGRSKSRTRRTRN